MTYGSHQKVWWRCPQGHSYRSEVRIRARGTGCPFCAGHTVLPEENSLAAKFPDLLSEWDTEKNSPLLPQLAEQWDRKKNGALTPEAVSAYSNRRVWWLCDKGHSFCAVIAHRVNRESDCPYCTNRKVLPGFNDLETKEPVIASQWHPTLNGCFTLQESSAAAAPSAQAGR